MEFTYWLLLITFIGHPFLALAFADKRPNAFIKKHRKALFLFFVLHNFLFLFGLSIKGDYFDYVIFSLEFLLICVTITSINEKLYSSKKFLKAIGVFLMCLSELVGLVGIFAFLFILMDLESDKTFKYFSKGKEFQTRRYSFGFATLENTRYTFETYRNYSYLPLEYQIDKTDFFDNKTELNIGEDNLKFEIELNGPIKYITFISTNGKVLKKEI